MGALIDRVHRDLTDVDVAKISSTYHAWRGEKGAGTYEDVPGFCKSASLEEIQKNGYILTPGRYVGTEDVEDDGEPFDEKMRRLTRKLGEQFTESERLEEEIRKNFTGLGLKV